MRLERKCKEGGGEGQNIIEFKYRFFCAKDDRSFKE